MKASELIKILQAFITTYGDLKVVDQDWQNVDGASAVEKEGDLCFKLD